MLNYTTNVINFYYISKINPYLRPWSAAFRVIMMMEESMNKYWLVTTEHLESRLWFMDDEDYKAAMNYVAILAYLLPVKILSFVLMSNHVHFVLEGSKKEAGAFITRFKKSYSQYYRTRYGKGNLLLENNVDIRELQIGDESFERAVAYVQMNPVAANICLNATLYAWGTGSTFFSPSPVRGRRIEEYGVRELIRLLHSKASLPDDWLVDENGFVSPSSYVPVKFVESIFRTPKRMNYFLSTSSKARRVNEVPGFSDQLILSAIRDLCISLFRRKDFEELDSTQQSELLRQIRYRFSADPNQLARLTGLSYAEVCHRLEDFLP